MVSFPFCKINLGLHVISRREDGYHSIETCFYPVPWNDILEIIPASEFEFIASGIHVPGPEEGNTCVMAWKMLAKDYGISPVTIVLHKIIPTGAGLGGGSSDGAFALLSLNKAFSLGLSKEKLSAYAARLGSDCAYFLENKPMIGTGRGELLHSAGVDLKGKFLTIVKPDIHVPTADAYRGVTPAIPSVNLEEILSRPLTDWKNLLVNDFEPTVFKKYPAIAAIKEELYAQGAIYACMSGSGASVFGISDDAINIARNDYVVWSGRL